MHVWAPHGITETTCIYPGNKVRDQVRRSDSVALAGDQELQEIRAAAPEHKENEKHRWPQGGLVNAVSWDYLAVQMKHTVI